MMKLKRTAKDVQLIIVLLVMEINQIIYVLIVILVLSQNMKVMKIEKLFLVNLFVNLGLKIIAAYWIIK